VTYTLPLVNQLLPDYRILWRLGFGAGTGAGDDKSVSGAGWAQIKLQGRRPMDHGFYLKHFERVTFPQVGTAAFGYVYGDFDDTSVQPIDDNDGLRNAEIRIQVCDKGTEAWRTVYWGTVDYIEDVGSPGALIPRGERIFHCVDGFYRTKRWTMDRHGFDVTTVLGNYSAGDAYGHPGYNWSRHNDGITSGNKSSSQYTSPTGVTLTLHTPPGAGHKWTDQEAVENALGSSKPAGEPLFALSAMAAGALEMLSGTNAWEVKAGESVFDFATRVLKRERGRGLVFVDWEDDSGDPDGPLTVKLTVNSQLADNIVYVLDPDTGSTAQLEGAVALGTSITVDLTGDHRCVNGSLSLSDPDQFRLGWLETEGEEIEVLTTLSYIDGQVGTVPSVDGRTLIRGWSNADQTAFTGFTGSAAPKKQEARYKNVFQLHRFNTGWDGYAGDGNGGTLNRADYRCSMLGKIVSPEHLDPLTAEEKKDPAVLARTSPLLVDVLSDLPLYEGYVYTGDTPTRVDNTTEKDSPHRRKLMGYVRVAANRYLDFDQTSLGSIHMSSDGHGIWIVNSGDDGAGSRFFSSTATSTLGAAYNYYAIVLTVALRLPHRVRFASGDPLTAGRRGKIYIPGCHLWLATPGAIHDLDTTTSSSGGYAARRNACGGSNTDPGILRDDRTGLAQIHALAWAWYGTDTERRSAGWSLKACGFLPSYEAYEGASIPTDGSSTTPVSYPTIGQVVTTLTANGNDHTLNTPITRVRYDAERAVTRWETEWHGLEHMS
jgi:hypothetical protein